MLERLPGGLGSDAQRRDRAAGRFLLLERAFDRILVERVDDQRRVPPCDCPSLGFYLRFRVGYLLDTGDDFQV